MSEQLIIEQCAPTLAGIKTANLFPCKYTDKQALWHEIRKFNRLLSHKGVKMIPVRADKGCALIYIYRPSRLEKDFENEMTIELLCELGYSGGYSEKCIAELIRKLKDNNSFPHEIGLFLGYPPEDVKAFIENKARNFKCVGCWKVYGDVGRAQKCFDNYKKCTRLYKQQYLNGKSIDRLTVAV